MEPELLELNATEIMDVSRVPLHLLEIEIDFGLGNRLSVVRPDNFRALMETARAAAPTAPNAESKIIHRQLWRRDNVEHADECLHPVKLAADVFT
jgi:hypothetical protein